MSHSIHRVARFAITGAYILKVEFEDGTEQQIDFRPVLHGALFGPLHADFDPATLMIGRSP
jgi:hypothetical protein